MVEVPCKLLQSPEVPHPSLSLERTWTHASHAPAAPPARAQVGDVCRLFVEGGQVYLLRPDGRVELLNLDAEPCAPRGGCVWEGVLRGIEGVQPGAFTTYLRYSRAF